MLELRRRFIFTRSRQAILKAYPSMSMATSSTSILRLRLANLSDLEVWNLRTTLMLLPTIHNSAPLKHYPVHAMLQTIHYSWLVYQDSKSHCKKFLSMKTYKSLVRTTRLRGTILSRFMASAPRLSTLNREISKASSKVISANSNSVVLVVIVCFQENRMKRLLWKLGHLLHSE